MPHWRCHAVLQDAGTVRDGATYVEVEDDLRNLDSDTLACVLPTHPLSARVTRSRNGGGQTEVGSILSCAVFSSGEGEDGLCAELDGRVGATLTSAVS